MSAVHKNFIAGEWVEGATASRNVSPSDTNVGEYAQDDTAQTEGAVHAAHAVFPVWARTMPQERQDILLRVSTEVLARREELGRLAPTLFVDADNSMRISREEIFGPVSAMIPARDYEHALSVANDTDFGLWAGVSTTSLKHVAHFKRNAEAGMVMVNWPTAGVDYQAPFGGRKGSSFGPREQERNAAGF